MDCGFCTDMIDCRAKVAHIETKCKYHKNKGQVYEMPAFAPPGLCRELFHAVYPESLAVLYSGTPRKFLPRSEGASSLDGVCPAGITARICKEEILPPPVRVLKELGEECAKAFYRPFDAHFRRVFLEITGGEASCPKGYSPGSRFQFNTENRLELCPAGFAALQPYVRICSARHLAKGISQRLSVHCPDYVGVTYELQCGSGEGGESIDFTGICAIVKEKMPVPEAASGFCPLALQSIIPYIFTLHNGGWFNWVNHEDTVIVNCPGPDGTAFRIGKSGDVLEVTVEKTRNGCLWGYEKGAGFNIPDNPGAMKSLRDYHRNFPTTLTGIVTG